MAKRKKRERSRAVSPTVPYTDAEGNVLVLRESLSAGSVRAIKGARLSAGASAEDEWRRRSELLFERLAVSWEISGLPLDDQKLLLGRYRMADAATRRWVERTVAAHVERYLPELSS